MWLTVECSGLSRAVRLLSSPLGGNNVISQAYLAVIPFHISPDIYITLNNVPICKNINKSYLVEVTDVPEVTTYTLLMRCWQYLLVTTDPHLDLACHCLFVNRLYSTQPAAGELILSFLRFGREHSSMEYLVRWKELFTNAVITSWNKKERSMFQNHCIQNKG